MNDENEIDTPEEIEGIVLRAKIAKINDLIESLPKDAGVLYLSTDRSWGGAVDMRLSLPEDVDNIDREWFGMDD